MTEPIWIDPITYAWKLCNPKVPLPEKLAWDPRGKFSPIPVRPNEPRD